MRPTTPRPVAIVLLLSAIATVLLWPTPAAAHATVVSSTPTADKIVPEAPAEVVVKFSEPVSVVASGTGVTAPDGSKAHAATPVSEGDQIRYRLRTDLPDGTYVVSYRVISADGHPVPGGYTFSIGEESKVPEAADPGDTAQPLVTSLVLGNRFVGYAGLLLALGPALLLLAGNAGHRRGALRLTTTGLSLVAGTAVVGLYLQAPYTAGTSLFGVTGADIGAVLGSRFGGASLARLLLVLIALPLLKHALTRGPMSLAAKGSRDNDAADSTVDASAPAGAADVTAASSSAGADDAASPQATHPAESAAPVSVRADVEHREDGGRDESEPRSIDDVSPAEAEGPATVDDTSSARRPSVAAGALSVGMRWLLGGIAVALAATWPVSGHATTSAAPALTVLSDTVHIGAATVWLGGLLALGLFLVKPKRVGQAAAFLPVWSRWATWLVAALAIAGLAQALIHVGTVAGLVSTTYGWLIIAKLGLFAVLLATAAMARSAVRRGGGGLVARVRRLIAVELVVGVLVLGVSTVLVQAVPAQSAADAAVDQGPQTFSKTFETDLYVLQFEIEPVAVGPNQIHLYLFEPDGVTELEAKEWQASFGRPSDGIELVPVSLALLSPNHTSGDVSIPQTGKWTFEFTIRVSKMDRESVSTVVSFT